MEPLSWVLIGLLLLVTSRRLVLIGAALLPARSPQSDHTPTVLLAVAVRDEAEEVAGLLDALDRLDYPHDKLSFALVSDGSRDGTTEVLRDWAAPRLNARVVVMPRGVGKAAALNRALREAPATELVAVYDADLRPHPTSLRTLAAAFVDSRVGAVSGYRRPSNANRNAVARYAALESWVHQLIVQAGKERLGLNPPTMGGHCVYRRSALLEIGGFPAGSLSEDIEVSLAMTAAGWRTRFLSQAVADDRVSESLPHYWNQRARWARGMYSSGKRASGVESWVVASGYADRLVFAVALALALSGIISLGWPLVYLLAPFVSALGALYRARQFGKGAVACLFAAIPMFAVDIASAFTATVNAMFGRTVKHSALRGANPGLPRIQR